MIAVTIGCGERYGLMAKLAARKAEEATGLPIHILGDRDCEALKVPSPHYLKLYLFKLFPNASSILYFDADLFFLRKWDPITLAGRSEIVCVRDRWSWGCIEADAARAEVPVREYFNTGLLILNREVHEEWLDRTQQELGTIEYGGLYEQTYLNWTRWKLRLPVLFLPKKWNYLGWESAPANEEVIGAHSDRMKQLPLSDLATYASRVLAVRALPKADPLIDAEASDPLSMKVPHQQTPTQPRDAAANECYYRNLLDREVARPESYTAGLFRGRGIVICGGGERYLPSVWINIRMLREHGCKLPIELWHLGPDEIDGEFCSLIKAFDVRLVDAQQIRKQMSMRKLKGWELKPFSILHSSFEEVLLLDADNLAVVDPSILFDTPEYLETGAVFWPDFHSLGQDRPIWRITGVPYRNEPEFESGQILINKARCWKALNVTMFLNEHSDYFYRHIYGDKDTFHFAWRRLGQEYSMTPFRIFQLPATMCQHGFSGQRVFQHRNFDKWRMDNGNRRLAGFLHEERCFAFLDELREQWAWMPPGARRWHARGKNPREQEAANTLIGQRYKYHRVGHDHRSMTFFRDGRIGDGAAGCEVWWDLVEAGSTLSLKIYGADSRTMTLQLADGGAWQGNWEIFEQMPIEITPLPSDQSYAFVARPDNASKV